MSTKGIRISDLKEGKCILLSEILVNIPCQNQLNWGVLDSDVNPVKGKEEFIISMEREINKKIHCFNIKFDELILFSEGIYQEIDLTVIGCVNKNHLHQYLSDIEMYETCDVVIEMIDGGYWEVFSKDASLIDRLSKKFKDVAFLEPDFEK